MTLLHVTSQTSIDRVFQALGDPTRRAILEKLSEGPKSTSQLAAPLAISLPAVVQQLQILEQCGLIQTEKTGRTRTCRLDPSGLSQAEAWLQQRRSQWEKRLDRLGDFLATEEDASTAEGKP